MSKKNVYIYKMQVPLRSANVCWVLAELVFVAQYLKFKKMCLGEVFWSDIKITKQGIEKAQRYYPGQSLVSGVMLALHNRFLHDEGCSKLGISRRVLLRLIKTGVAKNNRELLLEGVIAAFNEFNNGGGNLPLKDLFQLHLALRLSPVKPEESLILEKDFSNKGRKKLLTFRPFKRVA